MTIPNIWENKKCSKPPTTSHYQSPFWLGMDFLGNDTSHTQNNHLKTLERWRILHPLQHTSWELESYSLLIARRSPIQTCSKIRYFHTHSLSLSLSFLLVMISQCFLSQGFNDRPSHPMFDSCLHHPSWTYPTKNLGTPSPNPNLDPEWPRLSIQPWCPIYRKPPKGPNPSLLPGPRSPKPLLDHASNLLVPANDRVQLARLGVCHQVTAVLVQGLPSEGATKWWLSAKKEKMFGWFDWQKTVRLTIKMMDIRRIRINGSNQIEELQTEIKKHWYFT